MQRALSEVLDKQRQSLDHRARKLAEKVDARARQGRKRVGQAGPGGPPPKKRNDGICRFAKKGKPCKFGADCKFSHDKR